MRFRTRRTYPRRSIVFFFTTAVLRTRVSGGTVTLLCHSRKERAVARGTSRNNLYWYYDSVSVLSHCFRVVVKLLRECIAVQLLFFLASSFCGWCGASIMYKGSSFCPTLIVRRCYSRSCLRLHSDALVLCTATRNCQSRT